MLYFKRSLVDLPLPRPLPACFPDAQDWHRPEGGSAWSSQTTLPHIRHAVVDGFPQMWHWPMSVMCGRLAQDMIILSRQTIRKG